MNMQGKGNIIFLNN